MKHIIHPFPFLEQVNLPDGRRYKTPEGKMYPSVTTVLSVQKNPYLEEWKAKVGEKDANDISRRAANKGSKVHLACESYILGKTMEWSMFDAEPKEDFQAFLPVLADISEVHAIEQRMCSDKLEVAGTVDLVCKLQGKMCILDWKTSGRYKSREEISSYFMQCAAYSLFFFEHTGIIIPDIVIAMTIRDHGLVIFREKVLDWIPKFIALRNQFRSEFGY
jgi:genome maintenance exonuclease 1